MYMHSAWGIISGAGNTLTCVHEFRLEVLNTMSSCIVLRAKPAGSLVKGPHAREPYISLRMEVLIPFHAHPNTTYTTYEAEYRGHGISTILKLAPKS